MDFKWVTGDQREALYNEVWTDPVIIVAKRYGISDVALRKHCTRLGIPLPSAAYWARIRAGQNVPRMPLPEVSGDVRRFVRQYIIKYQAEVESLSDADLMSAHDLSLLSEKTRRFIIDTCSNLQVAIQLRNPHSLITRHIEHRKKSRKPVPPPTMPKSDIERDNLLLAKRHLDAILPISVSPGQINRAYRILDTLMKTLDKMEGDTGFAYKGYQEVAYFFAMHTAFYFELKETAGKGRPAKDRKTPGTLVLSLAATSWFNDDITGKLEYQDSAGSPLETQVGKIIYEMFVVANSFRARDELANRSERRAREEAARKRNLERLRKGELAEINLLEQAATDWEKAQKIRRFADCAELQVCEVADENKKDKLLDWLKWARDKADWLDPLTAREDDLLGKNKHLFERIDEEEW
ncbi:MAG: hypothetical protein ACM3PP_00085 [Candidatus Saccharibacteria bacterium]